MIRLDVLPVLVLGVFIAAACGPRDSQTTARPEAGELDPSSLSGTMEAGFEENRGQTDPRVRFLSRRVGFTLFLMSSESVVLLGAPAEGGPGASLRVQMVGGNDRAVLEGVEELEGRSHYFTGNRRERWLSDVPRFAKVRAQEVYPQVDLLYYDRGGELEYDFVVGPGADPGVIAMRFEGARSLSLDERGDLLVETQAGTLRQLRPRAYQERSGERTPVEARYRISDEVVHFGLGEYDDQQTLIIDPVLRYATYLGGSHIDQIRAAAVDDTGHLYVTGQTASVDFPTVGTLQPVQLFDAFVTKMTPDGQELVFSTFLGGSENEFGYGIDVDSEGNVYVSGRTSSLDFPTVNALQPRHAGVTDNFVTKLDASGSSISYSTYLGGGGQENGAFVTVDEEGHAYVAGTTHSSDFPTVRAFQRRHAGWLDAYVAKLARGGGALVFSTFLGGSSADQGTALALDERGELYVAGSTFSADFPTIRPLQSKNAGSYDGFVTRFDPEGRPLGSSYFGGSDTDFPEAITTGLNGVYIAGITRSSDFPTVSAIQPRHGERQDGFITAFHPEVAGIRFSTYLGGSLEDGLYGVDLDGSGNLFVGGFTSSEDFPTLDAVQPQYGGAIDAVLAELDPNGRLVQSTYFGGSDLDGAFDIAVDPAGGAHIAGRTLSTDLPVKNAFQENPPAVGNGFVAKIARDLVVEIRVPRIRFRWYVAVSVLSSEAFDVQDIAQRTVTFGPGQAPPVARGLLWDVNRDGRLDMIFYFAEGQTGIPCGQSVAVLSGTTTGGTAFSGSQTVLRSCRFGRFTRR